MSHYHRLMKSWSRFVFSVCVLACVASLPFSSTATSTNQPETNDNINAQLAVADKTKTNNVTSPTQTQSAAYSDTALVEAYPGSLNNRTPVILIHGLHGNKTSACTDIASQPYPHYFKNLILYLNNSSNYNTGFKTYKFHWVSDRYTTRQIAEALRERIDETPEFANKEIIIITHSTGGLIGRHYMTLRTLSGNDPRFTNRSAGERVKKLITLAAPHHGTYGANGNARVGRFFLGAYYLQLLKLGDIGYWGKNCCISCITNLQQSNRGSLLWDNFNGFWNSNLLYTSNTAEMNQELLLPPTYNHKIVAYWGEVSLSDTAWRTVLAAATSRSKLLKLISKSYTYGVGTDLQAALAAYLIHGVKVANFSTSNVIPENDGLLPVESARFDSPSGANWNLMGRVHCAGYNHRQLLDSSSRRCENGKTLFDSVLSDVLSSGFTLPAILFGTERSSFGYTNYGTALTSPETTIEDESEVELNNAGDTALQVSSLTLTGSNPDQFSIVSAPSTPFTILAKSSVKVTVRFNPTSTGLKTATLQASNNSANSVVIVPFEGFGMPASCDITLSPENGYIPVNGGNGSFTIPNISCPWTTSTNDTWIHPIAIGNTVNFTVDSNSTGAVRSGQINVSVYDRIYAFEISQGSSTSGCLLNLNSSIQEMSVSGGNSSFYVTTPDTCGWGAQSGSPWITIPNNPGTRIGSGFVNFNVTTNTSPSIRFGTIIVEGQDAIRTFIVTQPAGSSSCSLTLSTYNQSVPIIGGSNSLTLMTGSNCQWRVSSPDQWLTITSANNGTGNHTISYSASSNTGSTITRNGSIIVDSNGQTAILSVTQAGSPPAYPDINLPVISANTGNALINTGIYQSFVIQNTGPGYLNIGSIYRSSGSEEFELHPYSNFVQSGESTSVTVRFTPTSEGNKSATFTISSNDPDENPLTFSVSGTGVTQLTGGIDFIWANRFTVPNQTSISSVTSATINNNIYVVGGNDYKYDPTINSWDPIAQQPFAQYGAADVINGKIYLVGYDPFSVTTRVVIYDPANNSWITGATMPALRLDLAVAAANGKIYVFGGKDSGNGNAQPTSDVYEYNPTANTWTIKNSMPTARMGAVAISLNGLIYVIGGMTSSSVLHTVEVYNPANNTWITRESMPSSRAYTAAFIINSKIYVAGGNGFAFGGGNVRRDIVEEFDPSKPDSQTPGLLNAWSVRSSLIIGRHTCAAGVVNNKAYIIGGSDSSGTEVHTIEEGTLSASPRFNMPVRNIDYGSISIGSIGEKGIELQNLGNALLTINSLSRISGSADFTAYRYPSQINGGESINARIRFIPSGTGTKTATYRITTNDPNATTVDFTVTATGQTPSTSSGSWQLAGSFSLQDNRNSAGIMIKNGKAYITRFTTPNDIGLDVIDVNTGNRLANIPINGFQSAFPQPFLEVYGNQAYVTMRNLNSQDKMAVINLDNNSVTTYVSVGAEPDGVASNGSNVYVSNNLAFSNGSPATVKVVNATTNTVTATIPVGINPAQVVYDPNTAKIYVVNFNSLQTNELIGNDPNKSLIVIDPTSNTVVATIPLQYNPFSVAVVGNKAYVSTQSTVEVVDLSSNTVVTTIPVPPYSGNIVAVNGYLLLINNSQLIIIKADTGEIVSSLNVGNSATGISVDQDTGIVYVLNSMTHTVSAYRFVAPTFSIATNNQTLASPQGGSTAVIATMTSIDGWTGPITLSCEGLPTGGTCQFAQNPVNLPSNGTVNTNITINVPAGTVSGPYGFRVVGNGTGTGLLSTEPQNDYTNLALTVPTCEYQLASNQSIDFSAGGGDSNVAINGTTGCGWAATSNDNWITISSGGSGNGNGTVNYTVAPNPTEQIRTGTLTIAGQTYTIRQSGTPLVTINDVTVTEGNSGIVIANFTVSLSAASLQAITLNYTTANGTATSPNDYLAISSTSLMLNPGETSKPISVSINGDTLDESNETFFINLTSPLNAAIGDGQGVCTITDDDPPPSVSISDVSQTEGNSGTTNFVFTVLLSTVSGQAVSINWSTANGTATSPNDFSSGNGSLSLAAGESSKLIIVTVNGDATVEPDETFFVNLSAPNNVTISDGQGVGTILNDDQSTSRKPFDYDGDTKTDISIYRPSLGQWWINKSSDGNTIAYQFGAVGDKPVPADYDGDEKTDVAFWRPSTGEWFVLRSSNQTFFAAPFGISTDIPAPGDFDGDGKADFTVFRPSTGIWYINQTTGGVQIIPFGTNGDIPVVADYDGDGKTDIAIFRPVGGSGQGEWWLNRSAAGLFATPFGSSTDKTVQGDYTGDGKADIAFWRPSTGEWYILRSEDLSFYAAPFGANGDIPAPGDFDGDGKFDFGVFRPSSATWFILKSSGGTLIQGFGANGDIPTPASYIK